MWLPNRLKRSATRKPSVDVQPVPPALPEVERLNLRRTAEALTRAGIPFFLIPTNARTSPRLGIDSVHLTRAVEALTAPESALTVQLRQGDRLAPLGPGPRSSTRVPRGAVLLAYTSGGGDTPQRLYLQARPCVVEPWVAAGGVHRPIMTNSYASAIDLSSAAWTTTTALDVPGLPTLTDFAGVDVWDVDFPIDAVMLWVDGSDPDWQARRAAADPVARGLHKAAVDPNRFRQHGELRYALRSIEMFAPWIRRIHLVTDRQRPDWLVADQERVVVVDHSEIFSEAGRLPSFNSHAISARAHHVPGLSEHFLYLNDDVFFGRPVKPEQWFEGNGNPLFHTTRSRVDGVSLSDPTPPTMARRRVADLVERDYGRRPHQLFQHGPHALRRSALLELEAKYPQEFRETWSHQFRSADDIEVVWLHNYVGFMSSAARPSASVTYGYLSLGDPTVVQRMAELLQRRHRDVFCLNDDVQQPSDDERVSAVEPFLADYFPHPSSFERDVPAQARS